MKTMQVVLLCTLKSNDSTALASINDEIFSIQRIGFWKTNI